MTNKLLTVEQVSELLQVTPYTIRRWASEGRLRALKLPGRIRIPRESLEEFLNSGRRGGTS